MEKTVFFVENREEYKVWPQMTNFLSVGVRSNLSVGMDREGNSNMFRGMTKPSSSKTQCARAEMLFS